MSTPSSGATSRFAFLFPGQGSQSPGMGRDLYRNVERVRQRVDQATALIGEDLPALLFSGDATRLTSTEMAQITVYTLSTAIAEHLVDHGVRPHVVAGHSLGEYSALVAAGALSWEEGLRLVWQRGLAMAHASAVGRQAMAAIAGLSPEHVRAICTQAADVGQVVVANYNSPSQFVVSGEEAAVLRATALAQAAGLVKVDRLNVGGAFHSPLMEPARQEMAAHLDAAHLTLPVATLVSSMDGRPVSDLNAYRAALQDQITVPVRWQEVVRTLRALGITTYAEVGPGRVLTGLVRQCDRSLNVHPVGDMAACTAFINRFGPIPASTEAG